MKRIVTILLFWLIGISLGYAQAAPPNDECVNATIVSVGTPVTSSDFSNATVATGEYLPSTLSGAPIEGTMYFKFTLDCPTLLQINCVSANGSVTFVGYTVYSANTCTELNVSNLLYNAGNLSPMGARIFAAGTYYIQVNKARSELFNQEITLSLSKSLHPNDAPASALHSPLNGSVGTNVENLTLESGSSPCDVEYTKDFWFTFVVPAGQFTMPLRFTANGTSAIIRLRKNSSTDALIEDIQGNNCSNLASISDTVTYCALGEGTYYVQVLLTTCASGYFTISNTATLASTSITAGTTIADAIALSTSGVTKNINVLCNSVSSFANCNGLTDLWKTSYTQFEILTNGTPVELTVNAPGGEVQLYEGLSLSGGLIPLPFPFGDCTSIPTKLYKQSCGLNAGTYYIRTSMPASANTYSISVKTGTTPIIGDMQTNPLLIPVANSTLFFSTKCLTLSPEDPLPASPTFNKSLWAKLEIPTGSTAEVLNFKLTATGGNVATHGNYMLRLYKKTGTSSAPFPVADLSVVWNKAIPRKDDVLSEAVTVPVSEILLSNYCTIKEGEYWLQVLFVAGADFNVRLETQCPVSTDPCHNDTYSTPRNYGTVSNTTLNFEGCVSCSPPHGTLPCMEPYCSTFLTWNQTVIQTIEVRFDPISNPNNFKVKIWRDSSSTCEYITLTETCGNSSAVVPPGTYLMQIYTETPLTVPTPVKLSITLSNYVSPDPSPSLTFPLVSIGAVGQIIGTLTYDATLNITDNLGSKCPGTTPCDKPEGRAVGFNLESESFVKFIFDPAFDYKLYKAESLTDLVLSNERYDCGDSTYFCSLQPGKYILVLFSNFVTTTELVKITAWANCQTRAWNYSLADNTLNNLGNTGAYVTRSDELCCTSQRYDASNNEVNDLPTTLADRHTWFTWTTQEFGKFFVSTTSTGSALSLQIFYTDSDVLPASYSSLTPLGNYFSGTPFIPTTCRFRRYYMKVTGTPNSSVTASVHFTSEDGTLGDFVSNAYNLSVSGAGSFTVPSINIACHTLSTTPPDASWDSGTSFTAGLTSYKSTWFKIINSTTPINAAITLNHSLINLTSLRYRVLRTDENCSDIQGEVSTVIDASATPTTGIDCFNYACYYVQVITNSEAEGFLSLNVNATPAAPGCPSICDLWDFRNWNSGSGSDSWFTPSRWSGGSVPNRNTYAQVMTPANPVIAAGQTAKVGTLRIGSGLTLEAGATLIVYQALINDTGHPLTLDGTVIFSGCYPQQISGNNKIIFRNLEVKNSQNLSLLVDVDIKEHLILTEGNILLNGNNLTLLSTALKTAMITQKVDGSNSVIGETTVQRHISPYSPRPIGLGYTYISMPITSASLHDQLNDDVMLLYNSAYKWNYWLYPSPFSSSPFPNLYSYNESLVNSGLELITAVGDPRTYYEERNKFGVGWQSAEASTLFLPGVGYCFNVAGNTLLDVKGTLNNGNINTSITNTNAVSNSGWNLVGNPYPAPIDWDLAYNANSSTVKKGIYRRVATEQYYGVWAYYLANLAASGTNGATKDIAAMQGFFVEATSSGNLSFNNSMRVTAYTNTKYFRTESDADLLRISLHSEKTSDETTIYFNSETSPNFEISGDVEKAHLNSAPYPNLYTLSESKALAINGLGILSRDAIVPLVFIAAKEGKQTFKLSYIEGFDGYTVYLEDKERKILHKIEDSEYTFVAPKGKNESRFRLVFAKKGEKDAGFKVVLYPNPTSDVLKVQLSKTLVSRIVITDILGRVISETSSLERETKLDVSSFPSGVYIIEVQTEEGKISQKFVKEN